MLAMRIAIVGAGFTGLSAAFKLIDQGHEVTLFEAEQEAGGLAAGFRNLNWDWSVEKHYHHLFRSDKAIQKLYSVCLQETLPFYSVKTVTRWQGKNYRLDSAFSLLQFSPLPFFSRIRTGIGLAFLRFLPWQKVFDQVTSEKFLQRLMGEKSWEVVWQPLFEGKFGQEYSKINASWFWARMHVRSQQLGYPDGGFSRFAQGVVTYLQKFHARIFFSTAVQAIAFDQQNGWQIQTNNPEILNESFDQVLVTGSNKLLHKLVPQLPAEYTQSLDSLKSLGATTLVLELDQPFFSDGTYWLNVNESGWPFLAVVEHTNMISSKYYDNKHLLYVGKYLDIQDSQFSMNKEAILQLYQPFLNQLSPDFAPHIQNTWLFQETYAQPIVELDHHQKIPALQTPLPGLFWASMHHVYPWDRGTNYAVELGAKVASLMMQSQQSN